MRFVAYHNKYWSVLFTFTNRIFQSEKKATRNRLSEASQVYYCFRASRLHVMVKCYLNCLRVNWFDHIPNPCSLVVDTRVVWLWSFPIYLLTQLQRYTSCFWFRENISFFENTDWFRTSNLISSKISRTSEKSKIRILGNYQTQPVEKYE